MGALPFSSQGISVVGDIATWIKHRPWMWQHRVEPIKRWCSKARTEAVIQEIFRARGWHLDLKNCVVSWFVDWYHSDFSFLPQILLWWAISLVSFLWKTLGCSMLHAGTKNMHECDHIIQTKTGHSEVTGRQVAKMMLVFLNTWDSLSQANNVYKSVLQYYISL